MKTMFIPLVLLMALGIPALAKNDKDPPGNAYAYGHDKDKGAPGPIVGAGLPVLLVGGAIYWLVRRRKRSS